MRGFRRYALVALIGVPLQAHHGSAVSYDLTQKITLTGKVAQYIWGNPHVYLIFDVPGSSGTEMSWRAETYAPIKIAKAGWTSTSLKPGDKVTVTVFPSRPGAYRGFIEKVVFPDGKVSDLGNPTE